MKEGRTVREIIPDYSFSALCFLLPKIIGNQYGNYLSNYVKNVVSIQFSFNNYFSFTYFFNFYSNLYFATNMPPYTTPGMAVW